MTTYEQKKAARIERLQKRIERLEKFAEGKDLSLFGESKSGIPLGQPILVGHHSERRHRRHLERINNLVRKGYDASAKAKRLRERLHSIESNTQIQVDNPDAKDLLTAKLKKLETLAEQYRDINKAIRAAKGDVNKLAKWVENKIKPEKKTALEWAKELLEPDFCGRIGVPDYRMSNNNAEIRRLKQRLAELDKVSQGFESFSVGDILVELVDGQIQIEFPKKPNETSRNLIKGAGLAFKWSSYSKRWVRKHTASTSNAWFLSELKKALENVNYE